MKIPSVSLLSVLLSLIPVLFAVVTNVPSRNLIGLQSQEVQTRVRPGELHRLMVLAPHLNQEVFLERADANVSAAEVEDVTSLLMKYSLPILTKNIAANAPAPLYIRLFSSQSTFSTAVRQHFPAAAQKVALLQGFTDQTTAYIPLYQYTSGTAHTHYDNADLVNVLTHELTHVILNTYGISIPVWVNEGFASYNGMDAQRGFDANYASRMSNSGYYNLNFAARSGELIPLTQNSEQAIVTDSNYNLEFEDFAAVSELIADNGLGSFKRFLFLSQKHQASDAYDETYHSAMMQYETFFYDYTLNK